MKIEVRKHFENRFQAQTKLGVNLYGVAFSRIDNVDNVVLCSVFRESIILAAAGNFAEVLKSRVPTGIAFIF